MESMDDIMKQMKKDLATKVGEQDQESGLLPRVVTQKEDVVYIKNPRSDWGYNRVLNFKKQGVSALTISLQSQQAIALLLQNSSALQEEIAIE
eukprot:CAMPEP_0170458734 /NCGR_PEP_ID=MMETSP0123-20130129/5620_1 /TAXON_ID=182087 /ORGANISM="Favella ehrenbergii, Strain Fehren 1" /LENGTH=92 /DNA_ID=CAMNT_0010723011 /DNA_START=75 /DNA_END=353 /DNA_ORIENTATION=+